MTKFIVSLLIFFPYVGFVPGFDVQPLFVVMSIVAILMKAIVSKITINYSSLLVFLCLLFPVFLRLLVQEVDNNFSILSFRSFLVTSFHMLTIFLVFLVMQNAMVKVNSSTMLTVIFCYVCVAVIQTIYPNFLSFLVYRGYQELASTGRGVRSLASEPAVFGHLLTIFNLIFVILYVKIEDRKLRNAVFFTLVLLLLNVILARSAYSAGIHFIFLLTLIFVWSKFIGLIATYSISLLIVVIVLSLDSDDIRLIKMLQTILTNPVALYEQGAFLRVLNIPISIYGSYMHGIFGSGFDADTLVAGSFKVFDGIPYKFVVSDRNMGGTVEVYLRLGVLSLFFFLIYLGFIWKSFGKLRKLNHRQVSLDCWIIGWIFFMTFSYSSIANPIIWLAFFLIVTSKEANKRYLAKQTS